MARYAIYFAPHGASALWQFGSSVIGYDAETGAEVAPLTPAGIAPEAWKEMTAEPRRYGFHATLKAPFYLADGADEAALCRAVAKLCCQLAPAVLPRLEVATLGRFVALVPAPDRHPVSLSKFAGEIVEELDHLRAPLSDADRARRLASPLTARQIDYLDRYGYPYVRDEMRFHMTLTGPLPPEQQQRPVQAALARAYADAVPAEFVVVDQLAIYRQEHRDSRFRIWQRYSLA